jgi:predicted glycoside hydrolase/deacetylase ChbG (UPF0249 family)
MRSPKQHVKFIINADDLGASEGHNDAIFQGIADGVITSATIMATGAALSEAARRTREFPHVSFGVHLNLTTHRPVTATPALAPLLTPTGEFERGSYLQARWTRSLTNAVATEWTAQIQKVRNAGVSVSHFDSHHHVHTNPRLFRALKRVQRDTGIRRVRGTWSIYDRAHATSIHRLLVKRLWLGALRSYFPTRTPDEFCDFVMFLRALKDGAYRPRTWPRVVELMVHPTGMQGESFEEAAALRSGWLHELPVSAELISYAAL